MAAFIEKYLPTPLLALAIVLALAWVVGAIHEDGIKAGRNICALSGTGSALATSERNRSGESATTNARTEASNAQDDRTSQIQARLDAANATADRLRIATADAVRRAQRCAQGSAEAESSRKAAEALGAVFGACQAEQRAMAEAAERHLSAGLRCEAEYDALNAPAVPPSAASSTLAEGAGK